jgi:hypothetical protein
MKIRSVGAELFHAEGRTNRRTEMTKLIVAFRNFAKAPKNESVNSLQRNIRCLCGVHTKHSLFVWGTHETFAVCVGSTRNIRCLCGVHTKHSLFVWGTHETQKYSLRNTFTPFVVTSKNLKLQKCAVYFLSVLKFKFVFNLTNNNSRPH